MNVELLFTFRTLNRIVEIPAQQKLQGEYIQKSYRGFLIRKMEKNKFFKTLFALEIFRLFLFSILRLKVTGTNKDIVYLVATKNQSRQIDYLKSILKEEDFKTFNLQHNKSFNLEFIKYTPAIFSALAATFIYLKNSYDPKNPVILSNRILAICSYAFFSKVFARTAPKAVIVANDHSTIPLGFAGAARKLGIKTVYIQHAHIADCLPRLRFDLALLDGQCAADVYAEQGTYKGQTLFRGQEGVENEMNLNQLKDKSSYCIGLFLNVFYEEKLLEILTDLENHSQIDKVIIRAHPAYPITIDLSEFNKITISSSKNTLQQDCDNCDFIMGGNSSFHLSVLKYGVPTIYYDDLDYIDYDHYSFVKKQICYEIKSVSALDFNQVIKFYSNDNWNEKFSYFDASYQKDQSELDAQIKQSIKALINYG